jgi:hypothetical protein
MKSIEADALVQVDRSALAKSDGICFNLAEFHPLKMI